MTSGWPIRQGTSVLAKVPGALAVVGMTCEPPFPVGGMVCLVSSSGATSGSAAARAEALSARMEMAFMLEAKESKARLAAEKKECKKQRKKRGCKLLQLFSKSLAKQRGKKKR